MHMKIRMKNLLVLWEISCSECGQSIGWEEYDEEIYQTPILYCERCVASLDMVQELTGAECIVFPDNIKDPSHHRPLSRHPAKSKSIEWSIKIATNFYNWLHNGREIT